MSVRLEGATLRMVQHTEGSPNLDTLPEELFRRILDWLERPDFQSCTLVNQSMKISAIEAANAKELAALKKFIHSLIEELNGEMFLEQRDVFGEISREITSQSFRNLRQLKEYILDVKVQLINVIKTLERETITSLKSSLSPPHFLEDIFILSEFERQIDAAILIPEERERADSLLAISKGLIQVGKVERAIDIAKLIPTAMESWRVDMLRGSSKALVMAGNIDRAITIARSISCMCEGGSALQDIANALAQVGNIDRALKIAALILDNTRRGWALDDICRALTHAGDIKRAETVAKSIPDEYDREDALDYIRRFR